MYLQIVKQSFNSLLEKKAQLFSSLLIPLLLLMVVEYFYIDDVIKTLSKFNLYLLIGFSFFINVIISITVHRILLLKDEDVSSWQIYRFGQRELNFIFKAIVLGLIIGLVFMLSLLVLTFIGKIFAGFNPTFSLYFSYLSFTIISIFCALIFSRLSLVFPAIAIDKPMDFADALIISKKYKMLLFLCVIVFPVFFGFILSFFYGLAIKFLMVLISSKLTILFALLNLFITVFIIAFLSTSYEYIIQEEERLKKEKELENRVKPLKDIVIQKSENMHKINIHETHDTTFDELKKELILQYEKLGFSQNAIDREDKWMIKNPEDFYSYVLLSFKNDEYEVEAFNTEVPQLKVLSNKILG